MKTPVRVAVTGAAGHISYSLLFRIASGELFGAEQPVILQLLEVSAAMEGLAGVVMELEDCAYPLLHGLTATDDPDQAFRDVDYAFLVGARPRRPGMERKDLLEANAQIFAGQGQALNRVAHRNVKVLVLGNPANTNALLTMSNAPDIDPRNFSAMTRLDHNRAVSLLAMQCGVMASDIRCMTVWGNHSATQYPDVYHALVKGQSATELVDKEWFVNHFIPTVQQRGTAVIKARGQSSAASAANAAIGQMRSWLHGTDDNDWVSMAVVSDGSYGITKGLMYSFPVVCSNGNYQIVPDLKMHPVCRDYLKVSEKELLEEKKAIIHLL